MNKKLLLLTLVHPDFLPPVYATAQTLRDSGYNIHILTFDSFVPAELDLGDNIIIESIGNHHAATAMDKMKLRGRFKSRAKQLSQEAVSIISFCPFSLLCGLKVKGNLPLLYLAMEIADFRWKPFLRSPLSYFRNLRALQSVHKTDLAATPSSQRSAWMAGRCHLPFMPYTVLNTAYFTSKKEENSWEVFKEVVPSQFLDKKIVLYTGAVNNDQCIMELVEAFDAANDGSSALVVTGMKDNAYCNGIKEFAAKCPSAARIKLLPYVTRAQMLALQSNAHIGVYIAREYQHIVKSKMIAPNKVGEYTARGLYLLGIDNEYMRPFGMKGIASLAERPDVGNLGIAIKHALLAVNDNSYKDKIKDFVANYFCMQVQLKPVITFLQEKTK